MNCVAILDVACIIWNKEDYERNSYEYLKLKSSIIDLLDVFAIEKPWILLRDELVTEMINNFPYDITSSFHDYTNRILDFILNIPSSCKILCDASDEDISSIPEIIKDHFSDITKEEISYILTYIYSKSNIRNSYFTYPYIYGSSEKLIASKEQIKKECTTVFFDDERTLSNYFAQFKKIYEHNTVHHFQNRPGNRKSKMRCYNGVDTLIPQEYLNRSFYDNNRYYFFDPVNSVYVVFLRHEGNKYHGHEETNKVRVPKRVRNHFNA